jgi:hypothetical protein
MPIAKRVHGWANGPRQEKLRDLVEVEDALGLYPCEGVLRVIEHL